jgi:hypothetical protein
LTIFMPILHIKRFTSHWNDIPCLVSTPFEFFRPHLPNKAWAAVPNHIIAIFSRFALPAQPNSVTATTYGISIYRIKLHKIVILIDNKLGILFTRCLSLFVFMELFYSVCCVLLLDCQFCCYFAAVSVQ